MYWYPHHIGDYRAATGALSLVQHGAYRTLIDEYYVTGQPLPGDMAALYRICKAMTAEEKRAVAHVVQTFFVPGDDGRFRKQRIEDELVKHEDIRDKARAAGRASAAKRSAQPKDNERSTPVQRPLDSGCNQTGNGSATIREPIANNQDTANAVSPKPPEGDSGSLALESESLPSPAPVDTNKLRVAGWFRRRPGTPWSAKELKVWRDVSKSVTDDELSVLESYYTATIPPRDDYRRKDLGTLLNNWTGEVDRARRFLARRQQPPSGKDAGQSDTRPLSQVLAEDHGIK